MTDVQQDTSATAEKSKETGREMEERANEQAQGGSGSQVSAAIGKAKRSLDTLHYQRQTTMEGLQKIQASIEKATLTPGAANSTKLTSLHAKRRSFEERLQELASEEEILTRHLEALAQQERASTVELHLAARRNAHHEGRAIADRLRQSLGVLEGLYQSWKEWQETDRRLKDTLRDERGQLPNEVQMPDLSWVCALDANFQQAIAQVLAELHRSESALRTRQA